MKHISGWWYITPLKDMSSSVWDSDIPNIWEKKQHVPNPQPDMHHM